MAEGRVYGAANVNVLLHNHGIPCSPQALEALLASGSSSPAFHGARSMMNFEDARRQMPERSFLQSLDQEGTGDELDENLHHPEKKRRLSPEQVQFLERNFEVENKLEPERKIQLAKDLGLQPRQVAIWFQNRRARWKTKQLEKDYEALKANYNNLKVDYENLHKEKEKLKAEVHALTEKLLIGDKKRADSEVSQLETEKAHLPSPTEPVENKVCSAKKMELPTLVCKQEDLSSADSVVLDSDSPHCADAADGGHSSLPEATYSSNIFDPDHSDGSHTEEEEADNGSRTLLSFAPHFPKLEAGSCTDPPANSCHYGYAVEEQDQPFWFWQY